MLFSYFLTHAEKHPPRLPAAYIVSKLFGTTCSRPRSLAQTAPQSSALHVKGCGKSPGLGLWLWLHQALSRNWHFQLPHAGPRKKKRDQRKPRNQTSPGLGGQRAWSIYNTTPKSFLTEQAIVLSQLLFCFGFLKIELLMPSWIPTKLWSAFT